MSLSKHKALIVAGGDEEALYQRACSITSDLAGASPAITYNDLSTGRYALSKIMAKNPECVVVKGCPWSSYAVDFMVALVTPDKLPCDLPERVFSMKPTPSFIFLVPSATPLRCTHPQIIVENL